MNLKLYHGTTATALASIAAHGIKPRGKANKTNNWKHTVGSNQDTVYLTDSYAFYFAWCAAARRRDDLALVEVDCDGLRANLQADEDAVEQSNRGRDGLPADWDMKRRTIYYRSRAHLYSAAQSLEVLGTCGHRGTVPVSALRRIVTIKHEECLRLILQGFDPSISTLNYKILGAQYRQGVRWFFDDEPVCEKNPSLTRDVITVYDNLTAALASVKTPLKETQHD